MGGEELLVQVEVVGSIGSALASAGAPGDVRRVVERTLRDAGILDRAPAVIPAGRRRETLSA